MNNTQLEQEEISILLSRGYEFETVFNGKSRAWNTGKMTLGKMTLLSDVFIKMNIDEEAFTSEDLSISIPAQYQSVRDNAKLCVEAIIISIGDQYKEDIPDKYKKLPRFIKKYIKRETVKISHDELMDHFLNSFDSDDLLNFSMGLLKSSNYQNFMTSTALMNGNRPTKAKPIESKVSNPSTETLDKSVTTSDGL
ncbi:hypothetical protein [Elizabethkingia ursingii]|uniref:hypothetical protein n=1 Tax=Elizabethkingia ursingii TaxID=1756150 RepID=UPI0007513F34|nr:hypothetical protein [Elizabethkingia ursingii]KUY28014.1 hypothetical protein ATB96_19455 [Elizabethkingia ursingii]